MNECRSCSLDSCLLNAIVQTLSAGTFNLPVHSFTISAVSSACTSWLYKVKNTPNRSRRQTKGKRVFFQKNNKLGLLKLFLCIIALLKISILSYILSAEYN